MKKSFQIIREVIVPAQQANGSDGSVSLLERMKEDYSRCTGVFLVPFEASTSLDGITLSLKIADREILPSGFDASLIALQGDVSREEATYSFKEDGIPAKSSEMEMVVKNSTASVQKLNVYFILEN